MPASAVPGLWRLAVGATALLVALGGSSASAGAQGLGLGLAPDASGLRWNDGFGLEDALFYGGHGTLEFGRYVRLQAGLRRAGSVDTRFGELGYDGGENRVDATMASTGVLLRLGSRRIAPILAGSGGVMRFEPDARESTDQVFVGWGGGVGVRFQRWVEGRLLVQDVRMRADRGLLAADGGAALDPGAADLRGNLLATLGVGLRFGGQASGRADALDRDFDEVLQGGTEGLLVPIELRSGVVRFDDALGVGDQANVGVRAGVDLGPYFGLRGSYWRGVADGFDAFQDVQGWSGEAQFNLGRVTRASPFLILGYGQVLFDDGYRNDVGLSVPDQNALILGAGFGYPVSDRSRFLVSLRDHVTTTGALDDASSPSDLRHSVGVDAGFSFLVRGSRADRPAVPVPGVAPVGVEPAVALVTPDGRVVAVVAPKDTAPVALAVPVAGAPGLVTAAVPDSLGKGYQSDRTITLPVPSVGELYIRYGPPDPAGSRVAPAERAGAAGAVGAAQAVGSTVDAAALAALVRDEVARLSVAADTDALSRRDLAALEARIVERLEGRAAREGAALPAEASELARLEAQVRELTRIVREGMIQQADAQGRALVVPPQGMVYADPAALQGRPLFGGVEGRLGTSTIRDGGTGVGGSVSLFLGSLSRGLVRPFAGVEGGRSSVRTRLGESSVIGSVTSLGGSLGTYLDMGGLGPFTPSLSVALTGLGGSVSGDTPQDDELMERLYDGFSAGPDVGAHLAYRYGSSRSLLTGGVRRLFAGSRSRWAVEVGLRLPGRSRAPATGFTLVAPAAGPAVTLAPPVSDTSSMGPASRVRVDSVRVVEEPDPRLMARLEELERTLAQTVAREAAAREAAADSARARALARDAERTRADSLARLADARASDAARAADEAARIAAARDALRRDLESLVGVLPDVLTVRGTDRGLEVVLGGGMFAVGSATLGARGRTAVERVGARLRAAEGYDLLVDGHTDATGSAEANQTLSLRRAESVRAALVGTGLAAARISALGSGESEPLADNGTADGRARNRRVEIVLVGFGGR